MTAEIHRMTSAGPSLGVPEPDVVELLKDLLAQAEAGDVKGVAVAWVSSNDKSCTDWASGCANGIMLMGSVHRLDLRVTLAIQADCEPSPRAPA